MSFLKFADNPVLVKGNGRGSLSFDRAHVDNMPYRGPKAMLREEEYDEYTETVNDGHSETFDTSDPAQNAKFNEIVDAAANGWYQVYRMKEEFVHQPDGSLKVYVWCVWAEPHKELNRRRVPVGLLQTPHQVNR